MWLGFNITYLPNNARYFSKCFTLIHGIRESPNMYVLYPHLPFILFLGHFSFENFWSRAYIESKYPFLDIQLKDIIFIIFHGIKSTWNKFNWIILDNSNYGNLHGGGDFSHAYFIMHKYFGEKLEVQKMST